MRFGMCSEQLCLLPQESDLEDLAVTYNAKHGLVFSGSLSSLTVSKCYHALLFRAQLHGWKPDERRYFQITIAELDRITGGSCKTWMEYHQTLNWIISNVKVDWALFNRSARYDNLPTRPVGLMSILWDAPGLEDKKTGKVNEIAYRFPDAILDHFVETKGWFGQVDPVVLFKFRNHYGFNAYLHACMCSSGTATNVRNEFFSTAYSIADWRNMLGVETDKYKDGNFENLLLPRLAKQIEEKTKKTKKPMRVEFIKTKDKNIQMKVIRLDQILLIDDSRNELGLTKTEEVSFWAYLRDLPMGEDLPSEPDYSRFERDWLRRAIKEWRVEYERRFIWEMDSDTRKRFYLFLVRTQRITFAENDKRGWLDMELDDLKNKYGYWLTQINQTTKEPKKKRTKEPSGENGSNPA